MVIFKFIKKKLYWRLILVLKRLFLFFFLDLLQVFFYVFFMITIISLGCMFSTISYVLSYFKMKNNKYKMNLLKKGFFAIKEDEFKKTLNLKIFNWVARVNLVSSVLDLEELKSNWKFCIWVFLLMLLWFVFLRFLVMKYEKKINSKWKVMEMGKRYNELRFYMLEEVNRTLNQLLIEQKILEYIKLYCVKSLSFDDVHFLGKISKKILNIEDREKLLQILDKIINGFEEKKKRRNKENFIIGKWKWDCWWTW